MPNPQIYKSIHGRSFGLGPNNELIVNKESAGGAPLAQARVESIARVLITSAQLLAISATPQTLVPAPGAGKAILFCRMLVHKAAGVAYAGIAAGDDLQVYYTSASGAGVSGILESTGFLNQGTAQTRHLTGIGGLEATATSNIVTENAPIVLRMQNSEITDGTSDLICHVYYEVIDFTLTM